MHFRIARQPCGAILPNRSSFRANPRARFGGIAPLLANRSSFRASPRARFWRIAPLLVVMLLLVACGGGQSAGPANVYIADENDNGQTVTMGVGDALHLTLPENRSTGYVWSVVTNDETILRPDEEPTYEIEGEAMPGAGGHVTFNFIAAREGRVNLKLILARPQETAVEAAQTFALSVQVTN